MKSYKLIFLGISIMFSLNSNCQEFNGIVNYTFEIKNPIPEMVSDSLFFANFDGINVFNKDSYYQGQEFKTITYSPKQNRKKIELLDTKTSQYFTFYEKL
ncbi:MAG: hypothetical protein HC905_20550 [Bacteroidales bacterium]|nr:hypothetical protein [Bacteroidales bacterium]